MTIFRSKIISVSFSLEFRRIGLLVHKYFYFYAQNTKCAYVVALSGKKTSTTQYGYRICGTHARVFSQTLDPENSKNEIRYKETKEEGKIKERREYGKKQSGHETKRSPDGLSIPNQNIIIINIIC